jgi:hypothetical protein
LKSLHKTDKNHILYCGRIVCGRIVRGRIVYGRIVRGRIVYGRIVRGRIVALPLFKSQIISKHFSHFKCCKTISGENNKIGLNINKYLSSLESLETEFNERFNDFKNYKFNFALFTNPFAIEISDDPNYIQMELIELQCDSLLKSKYSQNDV